MTSSQGTLIRAERRSTPQGTGWCAIEHAVAAWTSPLKGSDLHDASSVTQRADGLTPLEFWEGPGHPEHDGGLLGQQQHAQGPRRPHHQVHQGWLLSSQVFKLTRCTRCTSEATKKREYRSPRPSSMFPMIPATAQRCWWEAECRRWDTDELRRGDGRGHHNMIWERSKVFSARTKVTRESQLRRRRRAWRRYSMGTSMSARRPASSTSWASPAAPTSTTSSSRAAPRRPTTTHRTGWSGSRQTRGESVSLDKLTAIRLRDRLYYFLRCS